MAAPVITPWDDEREDKMVQMWAESPCLFDITSSDYSNRTVKERAYQEIATALDFTVDQIKKRMRSLRTQFGKLRRPPTSGSATKPVSTRNKWILDKLQFLDPYMSLGKHNTSNLEVDQLDQSSQDETVSSDDSERGDSYTPSVKSTSKPLLKRTSRKELKLRDEKELKLMEQLTQSLKSDEDEDEIDLFGKYLTKSLRKFDNQTQIILKHKIQNLIFDAEMGRVHMDSETQWNPDPVYAIL